MTSYTHHLTSARRLSAFLRDLGVDWIGRQKIVSQYLMECGVDSVTRQDVLADREVRDGRPDVEPVMVWASISDNAAPVDAAHGDNGAKPGEGE